MNTKKVEFSVIIFSQQRCVKITLNGCDTMYQFIIRHLIKNSMKSS